MSRLLVFGDLAGQRRPHPVHEQHVTKNDNQATRVLPAAIRPGGRTNSRTASRRLRRLPSRHFGDTANSDVTVAFSGTAVTVLMALAPEGE